MQFPHCLATVQSDRQQLTLFTMYGWCIMQKKCFYLAILICLALLVFYSSCKKSVANVADAKLPAVTFTDDLGRTVSVQSVKKVATLQLSLAHVWNCAGGSVSGASSDAVAELSGNTENLGTMMNPNAELIISGGYDFVIMSKNISAHKKLEPILAAAKIPCAYFYVETFSDYMRVLKICTDITGSEESYTKNGTKIQSLVESEIEKSRSAFASRPEKQKHPRVLVLRASNGKVSARSSKNDMVSSMLCELGCVNIADSETSLLENLSLEKIAAENPEFVFVTTMGASTQKAVDSIRDNILSNPVWASLDAVKSGHFVMLPNDLFHYKPCERWAESYAYLNNVIHF